MTTTNPSRVYSEIRDAYLRYVDTAYWLRYEELMTERRRLLSDTDLLFTDTLLEPVLPYDATEELSVLIDGMGIAPQVGELVGAALFGAYTAPGQSHPFRSHQAEALRQSLQPGLAGVRNVVVTSGTGSGKTEAFLLPVLTRLVTESLTWPTDSRPRVVERFVGHGEAVARFDSSCGVRSIICIHQRPRRGSDHPPPQGHAR